MARPRALVLRTAGINCDLETEYALQQAGADAERVHLNALARHKAPFDPYGIVVFPGGFSYGDDVASGKVLAVEAAALFGEALTRFVADGGLVLGICNGFQVMVKMGLLTDTAPGATGTADATDLRTLTLTHNDSHRFEARWVRLRAPDNARSVFVEPGETLELPVAHGEGKLVAASPDAARRLEAEGRIGYRYVADDGEGAPAYPADPNGSLDHIAGLSDATGRVFGLMPHPERFMFGWHHPRWTREGTADREGLGMRIFRRAVKAARVG